MSDNSRYTENLPDIAAEAYDLSDRLCGTCRDLHALWPYIRLSRASTGIEVQASKLETLLGDLLARGLRRLLIAGSADTGLLALAARAGADHAMNIVVLDICATPLELCRKFAERRSLSISTVRQDLLDLDIEGRFDIVLIHGTLQFISADRRADAVARIHRAISPGGRLVLLFNTSRPVAREFARQSRADYANGVLDELKRRNVALPDTEMAILERLNAHARRRELREGAFAEPDEVESLLHAAGFKVESCTQINLRVAGLMDRFISEISKRQFMAIAEPKFAP